MENTFEFGGFLNDYDDNDVGEDDIGIEDADENRHSTQWEMHTNTPSSIYKINERTATETIFLRVIKRFETMVFILWTMQPTTTTTTTKYTIRICCIIMIFAFKKKMIIMIAVEEREKGLVHKLAMLKLKCILLNNTWIWFTIELPTKARKRRRRKNAKLLQTHDRRSIMEMKNAKN